MPCKKTDRSKAAKKAWRTMRARGTQPKKKLGKGWKLTAAQKAVATMKKGRRIQIHSPIVKVNGGAKTTYAPPKNWWDKMTKQPHGSLGKPLSAAATGHLWFKVYNNNKRLDIIKQYG